MKRLSAAVRIPTLLFVCALCATAPGQTRTWLGTVDGNWSNGANWSGAVVPKSSETAVFNNAGNGNTTVSTGSISLDSDPLFGRTGGILFDSSGAASYTVGGPNAGDGSITFASNLTFGANFVTVNPSVATSQVINTKLVGNSSSWINITNNGMAPGQALLLAGPISGSPSILNLLGVGHTVISGSVSLSSQQTGIAHSGEGFLTFSGAPKAVYQFSSGGNLEIDAPLTVSRSIGLSGDTYLNDDLTLTSGAALRGSGVVYGGATGQLTGNNTISADPARVLTFDALISGSGATFGGTLGEVGTVVLTRANVYTGATSIAAGVLSVSSIGDGGVAGNLGTGSQIQLQPPQQVSPYGISEAVLRYTGSGESGDRTIIAAGAAGGAPVIEQAGTGLLKLTGPASITGALTLRGDAGSPGELAGTVSGAIVKLGAGTWTLSGANSDASATVEGGMLALNYDTNDNAKLGGALVLGNGTLALTGTAGSYSETVASTLMDGTASITRSGGNTATIQLGAITRYSGSSLEISADGIASTNTLNKIGILPGVFVSGQFAKNSTNAAGGTIVAVPDSAYTNVNRLGGTIANNANALVRVVDGGASGTVGLAVPGTTFVNALMQSATGGTATVNIGTGNKLSVGGIGTILLPPGGSPLIVTGGSLTAGSELLVENSSSTSAITVNSVVSDNGSTAVALGKSGPGTLVLTGANTYSGLTAITGGVLSVQSLANTGSPSGIGTGGSGSMIWPLILDGGTLRYTGGAVSTNRTIEIGASVDGKSGTLDASGTGAVNFTSTSLAYGSGRHTVRLTGNNTGANTLAATIGDNGPDYARASVSLVKSGPGKWVLTSANTYSGGTVVEGGTLQIDGAGTPGANSAGNTINVAAGASLVFSRSATLVLANPIGGEGSVIQSGPGALLFDCGNSFSGGLVINSGGVGLGAPPNPPPTPAPSTPSLGTGTITMANNTSIDLGGIGTITGLLDTSGTGLNAVITTTNPNSNLVTPPTFWINGTGIHTFAGRITGNMNLIKDGAGTQFLNGANTYAGPTYINGGTLGGTGSISGAVYLNAGGSIAPGHSIGTFTLGSLDVSSGVSAVASGALEFELDTPAASDKINLTAGPLTIGTGILEIDDFQFTTFSNFGPGAYTLIHGTSPIVGSLGPNVTEDVGGFDATLAIGNGGADLVLNVVPEPASLTLAATALGAVIAVHRSRARNRSSKTASVG
jgi:fibronectin-binding autotransporter adhesin